MDGLFSLLGWRLLELGRLEITRTRCRSQSRYDLDGSGAGEVTKASFAAPCWSGLYPSWDGSGPIAVKYVHSECEGSIREHA